MTPHEALALLRGTTEAWVEDEFSDVVWAGEYESRWGIRMAQRARDFTTIWFDVGEITVRYEAFLLPTPPHNQSDVYRYCLTRSRTTWPATIVADRRGELYVAGRIPLGILTADTIDGAVGAVYDVVDSSFRTLLRMGFQSREKSV
jgi:hypothetical protein